MGGLDFTGGWNHLLNFAPSGLWNILAAAGVLLIAAALISWLWKRRKSGGGGGGGMSGFPWITVLLGAMLAGPRIVVPAVLLVLQAIVILFIKVVEWIGKQGL